VSSRWRSGDDSGEVMAGGMGWMSLGTTTKSLPKTKIAPALFAVPEIQHKRLNVYHTFCASQTFKMLIVPNTQTKWIGGNL
jgi:hypothetical protein